MRYYLYISLGGFYSPTHSFYRSVYHYVATSLYRIRCFSGVALRMGSIELKASPCTNHVRILFAFVTADILLRTRPKHDRYRNTQQAS